MAVKLVMTMNIMVQNSDLSKQCPFNKFQIYFQRNCRTRYPFPQVQIYFHDGLIQGKISFIGLSNEEGKTM